MTDKTPEARLLELIRKGAPGRRGAGGFLREAFSRAAAVWRRAASAAAGGSPWRTAEAALWVSLGGLVLYGVFGMGGGAVRSSFEDDGTEAASLEPEAPREASEVSLKALVQRDPFQPLVSAPAAPPAPRLEAPPPPPRPPLSQRAAHLRLSGVIGGDPPQAVIEDKRRQTMVYVSAGESLEGIEVRKVLPDRVILFSDGETLELAL